MQNWERLTLAEMEEFLQGSQKLTLSVKHKEAVYGFIEALLKAQQYRRLSKGQRGTVRRFLMKVTGLSRAQVTRLITRWMKTRHVRRRLAKRPRFPRRYTTADIVLLAEVDAAHEDLAGPAVRHILQREYQVYGNQDYERLAGISVSHIYNLRRSSPYQRCRVAKLLNKLLVEFTQSRAYRTTDNALVEGKNGAVIRKHIGYGPIGAEHAEAMQKFYTACFNPYLNYHRPCGFATLEVGKRGKKKRVYRADGYQTPYEKLTSLPRWKQYLKPGVTAAMLQQQAQRMSDTEAARRMQKAKLQLLTKCRSTR